MYIVFCCQQDTKNDFFVQKLLHQTLLALDFILNVSHKLLKRHVDSTRGLMLGLQLKVGLMMACMHTLGFLNPSLFLGFHLCLKVTIRSHHLKIPFKCAILQSQCENAIMATMHLSLHLMGIGTGVGGVLMRIFTGGPTRGQPRSKWQINLHLPLHLQFHHQNSPLLNPLDKSHP